MKQARRIITSTNGEPLVVSNIELCRTVVLKQRAETETRGHKSIRILHSGPEAQDKEGFRNHGDLWDPYVFIVLC